MFYIVHECGKACHCLRFQYHIDLIDKCIKRTNLLIGYWSNDVLFTLKQSLHIFLSFLYKSFLGEKAFPI